MHLTAVLVNSIFLNNNTNHIAAIITLENQRIAPAVEFIVAQNFKPVIEERNVEQPNVIRWNVFLMNVRWFKYKGYVSILTVFT